MVRFSSVAPRGAMAAMAVMAIALVSGTPVAAASAPESAPAARAASVRAASTGDTSPTWQLVDVGQRLCVTPDDPRTLYFFVVLDGTWPVPITVGYSGMPAGTEVYSPLIVPPGSGDGHQVQTLAAFRVHAAAPGRYVPQLSVTDGTATRSVPVVLDVRSSCW